MSTPADLTVTVRNFVRWNKTNAHRERYLPNSINTREHVFISGWNHNLRSAPIGIGKVYSADSGGVLEGTFYDTPRGNEMAAIVRKTPSAIQWSHEFPNAKGKVVAGERHIHHVDVVGISPVLMSSAAESGITSTAAQRSTCANCTAASAAADGQTTVVCDNHQESQPYQPYWIASLSTHEQEVVAQRYGTFVWTEVSDDETTGDTSTAASTNTDTTTAASTLSIINTPLKDLLSPSL